MAIPIYVKRVSDQYIKETDENHACMKRIIDGFRMVRKSSHHEIVLPLHNLNTTKVDFIGDLDGYEQNPTQCMIGCAAESILQQLYKQGLNEKKWVTLQFFRDGKPQGPSSYLSLADGPLPAKEDIQEEQGTISYVYADLREGALHICLNKTPEKVAAIFSNLFEITR